MEQKATAQYNILIVDDDPAVCSAVESILVQQGYQVSTATSAKAAMQAMKQYPATLIVLDLSMPDMHGLDLMAQVREQWPYTVIVILTAHGTLDSALVALRQGAHDYLLKPAAADEIEQSVRAGLEKHRKLIRRKNLLHRVEASIHELTETYDTAAEPHGPQHTPIAIAASVNTSKLLIDLQRHRVTLDGEELGLTPTEFNTLLALVQSRGRVVSYTELVKQTHGYECTVQDAQVLIKTHISHLRHKIRECIDQAHPIVNVRGIGYMWDQSP